MCAHEGRAARTATKFAGKHDVNEHDAGSMRSSDSIRHGSAHRRGHVGSSDVIIAGRCMQLQVLKAAGTACTSKTCHDAENNVDRDGYQYV